MTRRNIDKEVSNLEEALSNWIGDYGAAAAKQLGNRLRGDPEGAMSIQGKIAKEKFIQNFLGRASTSLNSGITSGRITTNVTPQAAAPAAQPAAQPAPTPQPTAPATPAAARPSIAPTTAPPSRPTIGNTPIHPMQVKSMQNNVARDKRVANMPPPNKKTFAADKRTPAQIAQMRRAGFSENSNYDKLNAIFESIMGEDTSAATPTAPAGVETISQFLTKWVEQYMAGTSFGDTNSINHIKSLIQNVENTYDKDKGKAALIKLANDLYSVAYSQGRLNQLQSPTQASPQSQSSRLSAGNSLDQIKALIANLTTQQKADLARELASSINTPAPAQPTAPTNSAPSTSSRVTESKKKPVKYWGQK